MIAGKKVLSLATCLLLFFWIPCGFYIVVHLNIKHILGLCPSNTCEVCAHRIAGTQVAKDDPS